MKKSTATRPRALRCPSTAAKAMIKTCPHCNKQFMRQTRISDAKWNERVFCSQKCNHESQKKQPDTASKTCKRCGKIFTKHRTQSLPRFKKQQYCSPKCAQLASRKTRRLGSYGDRYCVRCNAKLTKRKTESYAVWASRKYCSRKCAIKATDHKLAYDKNRKKLIQQCMQNPLNRAIASPFMLTTK